MGFLSFYIHTLYNVSMYCISTSDLAVPFSLVTLYSVYGSTTCFKLYWQYRKAYNINDILSILLSILIAILSVSYLISSVFEVH